jgi:hypothetical protein
MTLSFLNPWFWLGALALAVPIWLHLHRKQEKNVLAFSALRFLDDEPEPRRSPRQLRDWALFSLRVLALLLVLSGFAWPYLRSAQTIVIKESRVYILDNTLSHQAEGGFARDRDRILADLDRAGSEIQIAVIELTAQPKVIAAFGDGREAASQKLRDLQPAFQRGSYLAAFRTAHSLLANSLGGQKRIVFLADNQANQWTENVNTPAFLHNVEVELPQTTEATQPNLSLSEPRLQRIFLGDKSLVNFTVKLSHLGAAPKANVTLRANGQVVFERAVELAGQPGTVLLQAQWEAGPSLWLRGEVFVEGAPDALPGDNRVFFTLAPVTEGRVALLAQSPYLRVALSPEVMRGQWSARRLDPARLAEELATGQDADVLCVESTYLQSADARKLLGRYLAHGRGVLVLVNRLSPGVAGCLRELGFEAERAEETAPARPEKLQFIVANHPIFHPFVSPEYGNLLEVSFSKYSRLKSAEALPLVFAEGGAPLLFQSTRTQGRLLVAAFGLDREHTSWPVHQTFIPFLDLALQNARAEDPTPTNFEPGETVVLPLPPEAGIREVVLRGDAGELARAPASGASAQLRVPLTPGVYTLAHDDQPGTQKAFSVNPSPKESQLTSVADPEAMKVWRLSAAAARPVAAAASPAMRQSLTAVLQQRWWWWMLAAAFLALALETALAGRKRQVA